MPRKLSTIVALRINMGSLGIMSFCAIFTKAVQYGHNMWHYSGSLDTLY